MELIEQQVLDFLYKSSKENSNNHYDIKAIAGMDALLIANKLLRAGLIKDDIQGDGTTTIHCSISIDGIRAVDPAFVDAKVKEVLNSIDRAEAIYNIVDILEEKPDRFQFCFDLAIYIQNKDIVKVLYALFPKKIMVETTLLAVRSPNSGART
jgi:hypothetical protein